MADIWGALGLGLTQGAQTATQLMPLYYQGKAAEEAARTKALLDAENEKQRKSLADVWTNYDPNNPAKTGFMNLTGMSSEGAEQPVDYNNDDEMKGAAKLLESIAMDKSMREDPGKQMVQIAGGAIEQAPPTGEEGGVFAEDITGTDPTTGLPIVGKQPVTFKPVDPKKSLNSLEVFTYLRTKGLSNNQARGIIANIKSESGFVPGAIGDGGTSGGLFQHHAERFDALKSAAPDWETNWRAQIDFALSEREAIEYREQNFASPEDASKWFTINFERPANMQAKSIQRAKDVGIISTSDASAIPDIAEAVPKTGLSQIYGGGEFTRGPAGQALQSEVLAGKPQLRELRNAYGDRIKMIMNHPSYVNANPVVKKDFHATVIKPYLELAKYEKDRATKSVDIWTKRTADWSRNVRALYRGEIREAAKRGQAARNADISKKLTGIRAMKNRIDRFRHNFAGAKPKKQKELLRLFPQYALEKEDTGVWEWLKDLVGLEREIIVELNEVKLKDIVDRMSDFERELLNELKGGGMLTFQGSPEDIYYSEDDDLEGTIH